MPGSLLLFSKTKNHIYHAMIKTGVSPLTFKILRKFALIKRTIVGIWNICLKLICIVTYIYSLIIEILFEKEFFKNSL